MKNNAAFYEWVNRNIPTQHLAVSRIVIKIW